MLSGILCSVLTDFAHKTGGCVLTSAHAARYLVTDLSVKAEKYFENQNLKERKKMAEQEEQKKEPDSKRVHTYPLIRVSIMELKFLAFLEMLTIYLCLHQTKLPTIVFNLIKMIDCF